MKYFAMYQIGDGEVISMPSTNSTNSLFTRPGCTCIELDIDTYNELRKTKNGAYVENGVLIKKPQRPSRYYNWDMPSKQWILDEQMQFECESFTVREKRDLLLKELDEIVANPLRWAGFTSEIQAKLIQYRLDLLNVPQQTGFPLNVVFPEKPEV